MSSEPVQAHGEADRRGSQGTDRRGSQGTDRRGSQGTDRRDPSRAADPATQAVEAVEAAGAGGRHTAPVSRWADLGVPVHYVDHGGPKDGPLLVLVHGLGGSLVNWAALAPRLTDACRVLAVDLIGFGHTQAGTHATSVDANQKMLQRFLSEVAGDSVILVGNSMGGLITIFQAARHPESVRALILIDPALPISVGSQPDALVSAAFGMYAVPQLGRAMLRARRRVRSPEQIAMDILRLCCVDPMRVPPDVLEQHLELARARRGYPDLDEQFLGAARSLMSMLARRSSYLAAMKGIRVPVLLLHGEKDRLVTIAAARATAAANPAWRFEVAEDVGHVPQLEAPEWTAKHVLDWLASTAGATSTTSATGTTSTASTDADDGDAGRDEPDDRKR